MGEFSLLNNMPELVSKLSIFLFIIAGNFASDIYSCGLRHIFNKYMFIKHIIGFFIMLFFIGLVQEKLDIMTKIIQSIILYTWYIFIMRSPAFISLIVIIIICIIYLLYLYINDLKIKLDENKEINEKNSELIEKYEYIINILFVISFILSVFGTIIYIYVLKRNYRNDFGIIEFLLGVSHEDCFNKKTIDEFKKNPLFFDIQKIIIRRK